jgi:hypothetical protein
MLNLKMWIPGLLMLAITAVPVMAENDNAKTGSGNAASTSSGEANAAAANPTPSASPSLSPSSAVAGDANVTALIGMLVLKGVLAPSEATAIQNAAPTAQFQALVDALTRKGVLSAADLSAAEKPYAVAASPVAASESAPVALASAEAAPAPQAGGAPVAPPAVKEAKPAAPAMVAAIAPLRVLPVDPPVKDGLNAAFKMGPVKMTPYGFIKATAAYDSSSPNGDDFPFPGIFLGSTQAFSTGPTKDPEFHLKARSTRVGANFEWPDSSPKLTFTGRIEGDYEGNFSEVDNRDVSSIRSNAFQLRLAWARLDYNFSDNTDVYFEGGQDWTLFGSSVLPPILETTFLAAYSGAIWERSPQFQFGVVQKLSPWRNLKFSPTFAIMMPSSGQIEKLGSLGLQGQLAQAEREGADSGRPEVEGRVALQFQLDPAKGVAPAQILVSGFQGRRTSIISTSNGLAPCQTIESVVNCWEPTVAEAALLASSTYKGFTTSSSMYGGQFAVQLPTRWFTLVGSLYRGGDLRFFFGGQINSYYTDMSGLSNPLVLTTLDGGPMAAAGAAVLATNGAGQVVVAPQKPIRSFGGFASLGLPLSRWFNADPKGHNAGWQLYFTIGKDQVVDRDLNNPHATQITCVGYPSCTGQLTGANTLAPLPLAMGKLFATTLNYKVNPYVTFSFEQSIYATRLEDHLTLYSIAGQASNEWQDHRTEFGPTFTF